MDQDQKRKLSSRMPSGIAGFDEIADGGLPRGGVTVVLGAPGAGKTTFGMQVLAHGAGEMQEPGILVAFEESPARVVANTSGFAWGGDGLSEKGVHVLDTQLSQSVEQAGEFDLIGLLAILAAKVKQVGAQRVVFDGLDVSIAISTIADTWMHVSNVVQGGERNRALTIIKSRGMGHSNQVRELVLSDAGVTLADVYAVGGEVLMGTLRWEKENADRRMRETAQNDSLLRERRAELALAETRAKMATLAQEDAIQEGELNQLKKRTIAESDNRDVEGSQLLQRRRADPPATSTPPSADVGKGGQP